MAFTQHAKRKFQAVIGNESYAHAAGVYIAGSGASGSELLSKRSMSCMASSYIPDIASMKQSAILHASGDNGGSMRGDSLASVWSGGVELIRDNITQASIGVVLTWVALWDLTTAFRTGAYVVKDIQIRS